MNVEDDVERVVRGVIAGAIAQDSDQFDSALETMTSKGEEFAQKCLFLGFAICYAALLDINDGDVPDEPRLRYLTQSLVDSEPWAEIDPVAALKFLSALAHQTPVDEGLQLGDAVDLIFIVNGWLLSAFPPDDRAWTAFLDSVLDQLESGSVDG